MSHMDLQTLTTQIALGEDSTRQFKSDIRNGSPKANASQFKKNQKNFC